MPRGPILFLISPSINCLVLEQSTEMKGRRKGGGDILASPRIKQLQATQLLTA